MTTTIPGKLTVDASGRLRGPANITYNDPWPCANGTPGGGAAVMMGVVEHTMVGDLPGTVAWFNDPEAKASADFGFAQDGSVHQFGPIGKNWMAWAQAAGNPMWYSFEFADHGHPTNKLTAEQIASAAQVLECLSEFAGFPLAVSNSTSVKGLITHGAGGVPWGNHPDCPGPVRSAQREAIVELARQIRAGAPLEVHLPKGEWTTLPGGSRVQPAHHSVVLLVRQG